MFSNPEKNLKLFGLGEDSVVADLGAGTGYYALALGRLLPRGKIYAVEVNKDFLDTIRHKVAEACLPNVEIIWGNAEKLHGSKLGDSTVDAVVASNILFQVEDKQGFIEETKRILKRRGKVLLTDWDKSSFMGRMAIPKEKAREMFEHKGFTWEREIDTGEHHYGMILRVAN